MKKFCILFFVILFCISLAAKKINKSNVVVLCYHHNYAGDKTYSGFNVSPEHFREQLSYLKDKGYQSLTLKELQELIESSTKKFPERLVILTFDDGLTSNETTVLPLLKEFGFKGVLFIYPSVIYSKNKNYMKWESLKKLVDSGVFEIGSHTYFHPKLPELTREEIHEQLVKSKKTLENKLGIKLTSLAYPFGLYDCRVIEEAKKAGYKICFTINPGLNCCEDDPYCLNRFIIVNNTKINDFKNMLELSAPKKIKITPIDGSFIKNGQKVVLTMRDVKIETVSIKLNDKKVEYDYKDKSWIFDLNFSNTRKYLVLKVKAKDLENKTVFRQFLYINEDAVKF